MSHTRWIIIVAIMICVLIYVSWVWGILTLFCLLLFAHSDRPRPGGFVYFLADDEASMVKIGRTKNNPIFRVRRLAGQSPHPLRLLYHYWTNDMEREEKQLHTAFAHCRRHGEWFDMACVLSDIPKRGEHDVSDGSNGLAQSRARNAADKSTGSGTRDRGVGAGSRPDA
jgi:hypothetical protein